MKKLSLTLSVVLLFVLLGYFSCDDDGTDPVCTKDCPGDCNSLDAEACECIIDLDCQCSDGIKNGNEEYIDCGGDCEECACDNDICSWLSNSSQKVWEVAYMTQDPPTADTLFTDGMTDEQKGQIVTFYVDGTSKWMNNLTQAGPCYYTNSFDSVGNELLWTEVQIGNDPDCSGAWEDVVVTQISEDLFAYKLPNVAFIMYHKPIVD